MQQTSFKLVTKVVLNLGTPSFEEQRRRVLSTEWENPRLCVTIFPEAIRREFDVSQTGEALHLTEFMDKKGAKAAAKAAKVSRNVLPGAVSYSG